MDSGGFIVNARITIPWREIEFRTSRSGGKGGQNVNKVETKVELLFDVVSSSSFTAQIRDRVIGYLRSVGKEFQPLRIVSQRHRSQYENKEDALSRLAQLLEKALIPTKKRRATKPTSASKAKRIEHKRKRGETKRQRSSRHTMDD